MLSVSCLNKLHNAKDKKRYKEKKKQESKGKCRKVEAEELKMRKKSVHHHMLVTNQSRNKGARNLRWSTSNTLTMKKKIARF